MNTTLSSAFSIFSVALSTVILAFSHLFAMVPILVLYGIWFSRLLYTNYYCLRLSWSVAPHLCIAAFAILSVFWSGHPAISLLQALEFFSMLICTVLMARLVDIRHYLKGMSLGVFFILLSAFSTGSFSFQGLFGSKNMVGLFAEIGIFASLIILFTKDTLASKIVFAIIPAAMGLACMLLSGSIGALLSTILTTCIVLGCLIFFRATLLKRISLIVAGVLFLLAGGIFYNDISALVFKATDKDPTLTGRTYLWSEGIKNGLESPVFGHGYSAFWVRGQSLPERYWAEFEVGSRVGFHFHNLFIQAFVDLGLIGVSFILILILMNLAVSVMHLNRYGATATGFACLGFSIMFIIRAFVEVDFLGPFSIGVFIFYSVLPMLEKEKIEKKAAILHSTP